MEKQEFAFRNAFIARGIVRDFGTTTYGSYIELFIKERRSEITLRISVQARMLKYIGRNDRVVVRGYTRSFDHHNTALNRDRHLTFNEALVIEKDTPVLAFLFDEDIGFFCPEPSYINVFAGEVVNFVVHNPKSDWADVTIKTCCGGNDRRESFPILRLRRKDMRGRIRELKVGDQIQCYCTAWTPTREVKGSTIYLQQLIIEDYHIVNRDVNKEQEAPADVIDAFPMDLNPLSASPRKMTRAERIAQEAADIVKAEGFDETPPDNPVIDPSAATETADDSELFS